MVSMCIVRLVLDAYNLVLFVFVVCEICRATMMSSCVLSYQDFTIGKDYLPQGCLQAFKSKMWLFII